MVVMGVDLRTSSNLASTVAVLNLQSEVVGVESAHTDDDLTELAEAWCPSIIAIGTPLGLPTGNCCLESSCECRAVNRDHKGRQSELELSRIGISCFPTSKGSIVRKLIYRGIEVAARLRNAGFEVIEVYPHATKVVLFGDNVPPKKKAGSLQYMRDRLPGLVGGLESRGVKLDWQACDALVNAYTALLHHRNETEWVGNDAEGLVAIPRLVPLASAADD